MNDDSDFERLMFAVNRVLCSALLILMGVECFLGRIDLAICSGVGCIAIRLNWNWNKP